MLQLKVVEEILEKRAATTATLQQPASDGRFSGCGPVNKLQHADEDLSVVASVARSATSEASINTGLLQSCKSCSSVTDYVLFLVTGLRQEGLKITPDDLDFMRKMLPFDNGSRRALLEEYAQLWLETMADTPKPHQKQNAGRRAANTWLRHATKEKRT